ncbi:MAG: protein SCO1/2 [Kiritimatiellia bacterium]|jgi:protein SCO1/2
MRSLFVVASLFACTGAPVPQTPIEAPPPAAAPVDGGLAPLPSASLYQLEVPLLDQDGETIALSIYRGRPTIIAMFYASCPMACPKMIAELRGIESQLPPSARAELRVVLVSLDPERDGPELFREVVRAHEIDGTRWRLGRASPHDVRTVSAALGIQFRKIEGGDLHHETILTLVDADGVPVIRHQGLGRDPSVFRDAILRVSEQ